MKIRLLHDVTGYGSEGDTLEVRAKIGLGLIVQQKAVAVPEIEAATIEPKAEPTKTKKRRKLWELR